MSTRPWRSRGRRVGGGEGNGVIAVTYLLTLSSHNPPDKLPNSNVKVEWLRDQQPTQAFMVSTRNHREQIRNKGNEKGVSGNKGDRKVKK